MVFVHVLFPYIHFTFHFIFILFFLSHYYISLSFYIFLSLSVHTHIECIPNVILCKKVCIINVKSVKIDHRTNRQSYFRFMIIFIFQKIYTDTRNLKEFFFKDSGIDSIVGSTIYFSCQSPK